VTLRDDDLHTVLNDLWVGDVVRNQLPVVLRGLGPVRPLANVGGGVRQLIMVPMEEYQKDGRILRSIRKGASAFTRTTTSEAARLVARMAHGTGSLLQGAEDLLTPTGNSSSNYSLSPTGSLTPPQSSTSARRLSNDDPSSVSATSYTRAVSHYAHQPLTVAAGLRSAARHLERDLASARDAIIAVGTDVRESETASDVARAVLRRAPVVILKPAIGASRALGSAFLGAGNALDKESRRKIEDKYK